jgi:TolB-like protein/Tfp pilus assembly protein PilF
MTDSTPAHQRFFAELKRRNVFRVMAVYGIVGFIVLQVVDLAVPALLLPDWTYRLVALLILAGLPVAVVLAWAFEQTPRGLKRTERAAPAEIDAIVTAPVHQRWPAGLLALLGIALLVGGWWLGQRSGGESGVASPEHAPAELRLALADEQRDSLPALAVLPFVDMSPDHDQEYFSDGITEELLNTLARIRELKVLGRTSAFAYKGESKDLRAIGTELGAGYIVEGSVRKDGERLRITAQLIDASDGAHLWSEQYDRDMGDVFAIQTEIAEAIAAELRVPLGLDEGERLVSPTGDLEAYDLYLAGRARMRERGESVMEAIELFEAAIARDSNWAPAWAGLAESRSLVPYYAATADSALWANSLAEAEAAARRALELDPKNASAIVALGSVHRDRWNWNEAEAAFVRALTLDPENVEAHQQYADFLLYIGHLDEAYLAVERALALDRSPIRLNMAGVIALYNGRSREGIERLSEAIRADPEGRVHQAANNLRRAHLQARNWSTYRSLLLEHFDARYAETGDKLNADGARDVRELWPEGGALTRDVAEWITTRWNHYSGATMFLALGDRDQALEALEFYIDYPGHPFGSRAGLFRPQYDPLRDDPRFGAILAANGLEGRRPRRLGAGEAGP